MAETRALGLPDDHPKLKASSSTVRASCERIYQALQTKGLRLQPEVSRDGFLMRLNTKIRFRIDPKGEALRIRVGLRPVLPVPEALVHSGNQPDWIVVRPQDTDEAIVYLTDLVVNATYPEVASAAC